MRVFWVKGLLLMVSMLMGGCSLYNASQVVGTNDEAMFSVRGLGEELRAVKLTDNQYEDIHPKVIANSPGVVGVFWTSLATRTPTIEGRLYAQGNWGPERVLGPCVGRWDVDILPDGRILYCCAHWGSLSLRLLDNGETPLLLVDSVHHVGRVDLQLSGTTWYLVWARRSSDVYVLEGIYEGAPGPLRLAEFASPVVSLKLLLDGQGGLLFVTIHAPHGSDLWLLRLGPSLQPISEPFKIFEFNTPAPMVSTTRTEEGIWLVWEDLAEAGISSIYIAKSNDGIHWERPTMLSPPEVSCEAPAIASNALSRVYVVWTESQTQNLYGIYWSPEEMKWIPLWEYVLKGREASLAVMNDELWIAWERGGEIYVAHLSSG